MERIHEKQMENVEKTARRLVQQSARKRPRVADLATDAGVPEDMEIEDLDLLNMRPNVVKAPRTLAPPSNPSALRFSNDAVRRIDFNDELTEFSPPPTSEIEEQLREENARLLTEVNDLKQQNADLLRALDQKQQQLTTKDFEIASLRAQLRSLEERRVNTEVLGFIKRSMCLANAISFALLVLYLSHQ